MVTQSTIKIIHHSSFSECVTTFPCSLPRTCPNDNEGKLQKFAMGNAWISPYHFIMTYYDMFSHVMSWYYMLWHDMAWDPNMMVISVCVCMRNRWSAITFDPVQIIFIDMAQNQDGCWDAKTCYKQNICGVYSYYVWRFSQIFTPLSPEPFAADVILEQIVASLTTIYALYCILPSSA